MNPSLVDMPLQLTTERLREGIFRNEDLSADGCRLTDTCVYSIVPI